MELYDLNVERSVLSSIIFDPSILDSASALLDATTFYFPFHQSVYSTIVDLYKKEMPIDEDFIRRNMGKEFDEVNMIEVLAATPITGVESYVNLLVELQKKRELVSLSTKVKLSIVEKGSDSEEVIGDFSKHLEAISAKGVLGSKDTKFYIDAFMSDMESAKEGKSGGIESGLNALDSKLGGFNPGDLVVIAARPSMGKTSFATTMALNALSVGVGVYFSSLEMGGEKIIRRLVAARAKENLSDLNRGVVKDLGRYQDALRFVGNAPLFLDDESYLTIGQIKAKAIRVFRKHKDVKVWIIDHLRYIKKPGQNIANEVSDITKEIKKVAKEYGVTVFLLSQLNRANEQRSDKRPMLSDLRESGAVEEDADVVIGLHRESYYMRNKVGREPDVAEAELIVLKNRDGQSGVSKCNFNAPYAAFENISGYVVEFESNAEMPRIL